MVGAYLTYHNIIEKFQPELPEPENIINQVILSSLPEPDFPIIQVILGSCCLSIVSTALLHSLYCTIKFSVNLGEKLFIQVYRYSYIEHMGVLYITPVTQSISVSS